MSIVSVDLFSGCGGLSLGMHQAAVAAGRTLVTAAAVDSWQAACDSYAKNLKLTPDCAAVDAAKAREIAARVGQVDLLLGGPPCQGFSTVGRRALDDPRNSLVRAYMQAVEILEPSVFVMENVSGFVTLQQGRIFAEVVEYAENLGYRVHAGVLIASAYGVPQHRRRCFLVGVPDAAAFTFPAGIATNLRSRGRLEVDMSASDLPAGGPVTFRQATGDLPAITAGSSSSRYARPPQNDFQRQMRTAAGGVLTEHAAGRHSTKLLRMMRHIPEGRSAHDPDVRTAMPADLRPSSGFANTYARIRNDAPAPTITRNFSTPSAANCIHPTQDRALTLREAARCQTFPDHYVFHGNRSERKLQVGNAVPPGLARALGGAIMPLL